MIDKIQQALASKPLTMAELAKKLGFCCLADCNSRYNLAADVTKLVDCGKLEITKSRKIKLRNG